MPDEALRKASKALGPDCCPNCGERNKWAKAEDLEGKYEIRLPDDFRDYLLYACPKDDAAGDDVATSWWPLSRIKNIPCEYEFNIVDEVIARNAAKYIFFADYAIWCMAWAICCDESENRGRVAVIGSDPDRFVAADFAQFVDIYIKDVVSLI